MVEAASGRDTHRGTAAAGPVARPTHGEQERDIPKPLIVTSLNPKGRFEHQQRCFDRWRALGYTVRSYNSEAEKNDLVARGVPAACIVVLTSDDTAVRAHGFPAPRLMPVLRDVLARGVPSVLVVNSDIYPALRRGSMVFDPLGPCSALTRNEVPALALGTAGASGPYRGGLDNFYFTHDALKRVLARLEREPVAELMAFGVPGWDFYLGAHVISPAVGGRICDADFLLHVTHPTTYSGVGKFAAYIPAIRDMGFVTSDDAAVAANEFAHEISTRCHANRRFSRELALAGADYAQEVTRATRRPASFSASVALIESMNRRLLPSRRVDPAAVVAGAADSANPMATLRGLLNRAAPPHDRFGAGLRALKVALLVLPVLGRFRKRLTVTYPKGNLHGKVIELILGTKDRDEFRIALLDVFSDELVTYGIFNRRVLECLCLCCENEEERRLVSSICHLIRESTHDRAA